MPKIEFFGFDGQRITRDEWVKLIGSDERQVAYEKFVDDDGSKVIVSTVWLGISPTVGKEKPRIFETMVFGGVHDGFVVRHATLKEAVKGHENVMAFVGGRRSETWQTQKPLFSDP